MPLSPFDKTALKRKMWTSIVLAFFLSHFRDFCVLGIMDLFGNTDDHDAFHFDLFS